MLFNLFFNSIICRCVQDDPNQDHLVHYSRFVISPLFYGEANTLGTAIRRSLLSLSGYSIQLVKISGASHEYSILEGILESVHEILINLQKVIVVAKNKDFIHGSIIAEGIGNVTALYVNLPPDVYIINPNQHIVTLTKDNSKICIDVKIFKDPKSHKFDHIKQDDNYFFLDNNISSIRNVNYTVHPIMSMDKDAEMLVMEIWTNKSISPNEALYQAAQNLINLLQIFYSNSINTYKEKGSHREQGTQNLDYKDGINQENKSENKDFNEMNISTLNLSTRTYNSLYKANIYTISDLLQYTQEDLLKIRNFGQRSAEQVIHSLKNIGIILN